LGEETEMRVTSPEDQSLFLYFHHPYLLNETAAFKFRLPEAILETSHRLCKKTPV
jgi:hypothetical protein